MQASSKASERTSLTATVPKWARLARLWFTGEERWKAWGYASATIALALTTTGLLVKISYAQRDFSTALSGKNAEGFYHAIRQFVVIICVAAPLFSFTKFVEDRMVLAWRAYLTRQLLQAYFKNKAFFRIGLGAADANAGSDASSAAKVAPSNSPSASSDSSNLDNPDQRICDDVGAFVASSTTITLALCKKLFNCAAFAGVLWSVSGQLVVFMFIYAGVGTLVTTSVFGKVLMRLFYNLLALEGDMRYSLVRVRESAESIAFYGGEKAEARTVNSRLNAVLSAAATRIRFSGYYDLWTSIYQYATILAPSLLTAPRYFAGEIEFGTISQTSFAFSSISQALSIIITNLGQITGLAAETDRLYALLTALQSYHHSEGRLTRQPLIRRELSPEVGGLHIHDLTLNLPGRPSELLCQNLSLELQPGQSLLIVGASGCGKSSLLRALSGLWPQGSGSVFMPLKTFFLPQKPYMPIGTLRHQLLFPSAEDLGEEAEGPQQAFSSATKGESYSNATSNAETEHTPLLSESLTTHPTSPTHAPLSSPKDKNTSPRPPHPPNHPASPTASAPTSLFQPSLLQSIGSLWSHMSSHKSGGAAKWAGADGKHNGGPGGHSNSIDISVSAGTGVHSSWGVGARKGGGVGNKMDRKDSLVAKATSMELSQQSGLSQRKGAGGGGSGGACCFEFGGGGGCGRPLLSDAELHELLEDVRLEELAQKVGGLDAQCDWSQMLSSGEQQRVAILRMLAHSPQLAFMDEATSAVDGQLETILYSLIRARCPCYVSVGHRMQLLHYHTHVLEFCEGPAEGAKGSSSPQWQMCTAQEFQQRLASKGGQGLSLG